MVAAEHPPVKFSPDFHRKVAAQCALLGWSQSDLAREIGRSRVAVNRALNHGLYQDVLRLIRQKLNIV